VVERKRRAIIEAMESLPPQYQAAFKLKVVQGLSYGEIARKLGISAATVERQVAGGLLHVHDYLKKYYPFIKH
jgi:RNA polymerase sigma factor (sigma-70 family)